MGRENSFAWEKKNGQTLRGEEASSIGKEREQHLALKE